LQPAAKDEFDQFYLQMRIYITLFAIFLALSSVAQSLSHTYLHYKTDLYWDTILYKTEMAFFYDRTGGSIVEKSYPMFRNLYTELVSDTPFVTKEVRECVTLSHYPYVFVRKGNGVYLRFLDLTTGRSKLHKEYSLKPFDTVKGLAEKSTLDSRSGISADGYAIFVGEEPAAINGKVFRVFHFQEWHSLGSHAGQYTKDVYIEKRTLIPIKFITKHFNDGEGEGDRYSTVTTLHASGNKLLDYSKQLGTDLVLYENTSTHWSQQQKEDFLSGFPGEKKAYASCLLSKLDGQIPFFNFRKNSYFIALVANGRCE